MVFSLFVVCKTYNVLVINALYDNLHKHTIAKAFIFNILHLDEWRSFAGNLNAFALH